MIPAVVTAGVRMVRNPCVSEGFVLPALPQNMHFVLHEYTVQIPGLYPCIRFPFYIGSLSVAVTPVFFMF